LTVELFLKDHYLRQCDAMVTGLIDEKSVVLDQTVFYPQGGGQPSDTGVLTRENESFFVSGCRRNGAEIVHVVDKPGLRIGDYVKGTIDWDRRHRLMRSHTSAHLLAHVLFSETGALITGNQLDLDQCRMDFSSQDVGRERLKDFEQKTNDLIARNLAVSTSFEKFEDAVKRPELFRLKDVLPKNLPVLRIVSIGDVDVQADGGTHVAFTKEVGGIEIFDLKNKGAENRRIYWRLSN